MGTALGASYATATNKVVTAANGVRYAYREVGAGTRPDATPLVLLQHFRGNLDNWDPALVDALAANRRVVAFDNVGVGGSSGTTPDTVEQMARDAIAFITALGLSHVDVLGFSIGSFVAQEIALIRPALIHRLVLASSAPRGATGMHGWAPEVVAAVGRPEPDPAGYLDVFFSASPSSRATGQEVMGRVFARTFTSPEDADVPASWATMQAQYDAVSDWGIPDHAALQRVSAINVPVFIANGDSDPMILPHYSHLLAGLIPQATIKIYRDSAHGFLFQHHAEFAADTAAFLDAA